MPYRKNVRKTKKRIYKRRRTRKSVMSIGRMPVPKSSMVKFKYFEDVSLSPATGLNTQYFFRANSLYDPNLTGVGHQPLGYDQLSVFYNHYTVVSAKITVTFNPLWGGVNFKNGRVAIQLCADNDNISSPSQMLEQNELVYRNITEQKDLVTLSKTFSAKKFFGLSKGGLVGENRFTSTMDTSPVEGAYFRLVNIPIDGSASTPSIVCNCKIEYIAVLTEPKTLAQS